MFNWFIYRPLKILKFGGDIETRWSKSSRLSQCVNHRDCKSSRLLQCVAFLVWYFKFNKKKLNSLNLISRCSLVLKETHHTNWSRSANRIAISRSNIRYADQIFNLETNIWFVDAKNQSADQITYSIWEYLFDPERVVRSVERIQYLISSLLI